MQHLSQNLSAALYALLYLFCLLLHSAPLDAHNARCSLYSDFQPIFASALRQKVGLRASHANLYRLGSMLHKLHRK